MEEIGYQHDPEEWRLSIDASKVSLKAVLLRNGNVTPSTPVAHSVARKKTHDSLSFLLNAVKKSMVGRYVGILR
jgi:hypothetical protein